MSFGAQIAPDYEAEAEASSSSSSFSSDNEDQRDRRESLSGAPPTSNIEKIETAHEGQEPRPSPLRQGRSSSSAVLPVPVGFWHWEMNGVRLHVLQLWMRTNLILAIAILAFLCLFWGVLFNQNKLSTSIKVWVVDFDGQIAPYLNEIPLVGPVVTGSVQKLIDSRGIHPGYTFRSPVDFANDPMQVRESVYNQDAYAAVIINANATALLRAAVEQGNTTYDPKGAGQVILNSARDQATSSSYIVPSITALQSLITLEFGSLWVPSVLQNGSISTATLGTVPQALSPGIAFTIYDLRPFGPPVATPAVSIGLIYLIIVSFFSFTFFLPIHMKYITPKGHPPLHFYQLIIWRWAATVVSYCLLSCVYSLVSLAFLMPMSNLPASHTEPAINPNAYHHGTFVVYWMINFVAMAAFGLACENMAMFLGTPWTALWLIFWVISNVATGFYALPQASRFYRWGYAWPMHNVVEATRSTLFDLHPRIGLNFGILFAWCAIDTVLFPFACYYMRWRTIREKKLAAKKEAEWQAKMQKEKDEPSLFTRVTTRGSPPER
ncbi:uncharacterized protein K441DRAFT_601358 [Cenococcum geophilum 1.58]|uniref:uncharacterized protein n=1 Tax=Cenococcum geophilum 1.58 TaxID=794803 RepID=UPI00358E31E5|nr:hypothetical protein K441DRAFT_601358 [Cenococcum geophilum 1.58]